jgi:hypothetical protein
VKARLACSLTALEREELEIQVRAWIEVLEEVPPYALNECYRRAIRQHDGRGPFGAFAIARVWMGLGEMAKRDLRKANARAALVGEQCVWCSGRGFMRLLSDGTPVEWNDGTETNDLARCQCRGASERRVPDVA